MRAFLTIIPAYNEEDTIREVVERAIKYTDVCVVNDNSRDSTPIILEKLKNKYGHQLHVIHHQKNTHIPQGIKDGMSFAVTAKYPWVITMDAGMSHNPDELQNFIIHPFCDLLIGARHSPQGVPLYRKLISFLGARVMNYAMSKGKFDFFGPRVGDCTSGFRRYSQKMFSEISVRPHRSVSFDFHMEALSIVNELNGTIKEINITYNFSNSSFNRNVLKQAINFAWSLIKTKWREN